MSNYAWTITHDLLSVGEYASESEVGVSGPHDATEEQIAKAKGRDGVTFKMYDDDGIHYYTGRIWHRDGPGSCDFQPLEDFGTPNAGCTDIKYKNAEGKFEAI
jgi:hypothetical protein